MKRFTKQALAIVAIAAFAVAGCKKGNEGSFNRSNGAGGPFNGADSVITGNITASRTLTPGKVYRLNGVVYVTGGAKLTIKPGTVITSGEAVGYKVTPTSETRLIKGVLVVTKGSSIDAVGLPDQPIIFTTPNAPGARKAGDFGGIILLGSATTNQASTTVIEGLPTYDANGNPLGVDITYGGGNPDDDSGKMEYVRIEYAGFVLAPNIEVNGLTLGGVGHQTDLDHIQVSYGADDAFEFFGGTVDASYLLAVGCDDDDFDTDFGYSGTITYAIGLKDPSSTHSGSATAPDSNGIESDTEAANDNTNPVKTHPIYSNFTLLGYAAAPAGGSPLPLGDGAKWRRNTDLTMTNSIIAGYDKGVEFLNATATAATPGQFTENVVHAYTTVFNPTTAVSLTGATNTTSTAANPDSFIALGASGLSPFYTSAVSDSYSFDNLLPRTSSTKGAVTAANYDEWAAGWAQFNFQNSVD